MTHHLRAFHDAILVGVGTVIADNPSLTTRLVKGSNPKPIVLDPNLRIPLDSKLLISKTCERPIVITSKKLKTSDIVKRVEDTGASVLFCETEEKTGHISLSSAMNMLTSFGTIRSVMVEGGASVLTSFLASGLGDEVVITIGPCFLLNGLEYGNSTFLDPRKINLSSVITRCVENGDVWISGTLSSL